MKAMLLVDNLVSLWEVCLSIFVINCMYSASSITVCSMYLINFFVAERTKSWYVPQQRFGAHFLDDLDCTGTENRLINCSHGGIGSHNCGYKDAGVMCRSEC